ncbi:hypothetical protein [Aeromonas enteropelogenes]|uniref:hypothetical protein n=1 Tax=Aeromonas enteropelogenes TaxID=29489 RepID=UPI0022861132|nr:hypothetical protein [Aeromonas enteropelogenes]MCZ0753918.1 hypothetical protein [Aeromonas enteropelogenes]
MSKTISVVDDSVGSRTAISMTLSSAGFDVIEASDGEAPSPSWISGGYTSSSQISTCPVWMA